MSTTTSTTTRAGLVVLGLLSLGDLATPLVTDGETPPMAVALVSAALGLASLVLVISAWRGARRAVAPLLVLRGLSALAAAPAFFVNDVPAGAVAAAAGVVVFTIIGAAMVLPSRSLQTAGAR